MRQGGKPSCFNQSTKMKLKKPIVQIVSVLVLMYSCKSTNYIKYHRIVSEAEYSFFKGDYRNSSKLYEKAFKKVKVPVENDMYFLSASLWEIGMQEKSVALLDTLYLTEWMLMKSGFYQGMDSVLRNEIIVANKPKVKEIHDKRDTHPLLSVFEFMDERDQLARRQWEEIMNEHPNDKLLQQQAWKQVDSVDALNLLMIDSLINIHGFIGGVCFPAHPKIMHLSLQHQLEWVYENPKIFTKAIKQGRLFPELYASAYDKALILIEKDSIMKFCQYSRKKHGVNPEEVFKDCKKIGVSPYYFETLLFPNKKGSQPEKHFYYDYYEARKSRFSCY